MPAHIYARTGDHAASARANAGGAAADEKYLATVPPDSMYGLMYYSHNLQFLADSEMMQGRFADAQPPAALLAKRLDGFTAMLPMVESILVQPVSVLLRFNKHDDVLKLAPPPADRPVQTAWYHFARGVAFARTGKLDDAATERAALAQAAAKIPDSALWGGGGFTTAHEAMDIATLVLDARIAWAKQQQRSVDSTVAARSGRCRQAAVRRAAGLVLPDPRIAGRRAADGRQGRLTPNGCSARISIATRATRGRCSGCRPRWPSRAKTPMPRGCSGRRETLLASTNPSRPFQFFFLIL